MTKKRVKRLKGIVLGKELIVVMLLLGGILVGGGVWRGSQRETGVLTVGTNAPYEPMEFYQEGKLTGVDVDLMELVARDMKRKLIWRNYESLEAAFEGLKKDEVDLLISAITITPERAKEMVFSAPYFNGGQVLVTKKDMKLEGEINDWRVGVQKATTSWEEAKKRSNKVVGYDNYDEAVKSLRLEKLEAIMVDYVAALGMVKSAQDLEIKGEPITEEFYGVAANKPRSDLVAEVDKTIGVLKTSGKLKGLIESWVSKYLGK
jgi:polar amino acid transport system substrate-binding protein